MEEFDCLLGFDGKSALLGHEMAYCLGQIDDVYALPILQGVLENEEEHPMVRHEVSTGPPIRAPSPRPIGRKLVGVADGRVLATWF